jgi:hypothetical protein
MVSSRRLGSGQSAPCCIHGSVHQLKTDIGQVQSPIGIPRINDSLHGILAPADVGEVGIEGVIVLARGGGTD